jgi:hypothetical protein
MSETAAFLSDPADPSIRVPAVPAPWSLEGRGYIVLYRFKDSFVRERGFLPEGASPSGGLGSVMLVDYRSSDAGPYRELLFIPGKLDLAGGRWHRITKIYVSTMESVLNGRKNWAIPKDRADFDFSGGRDGESVTVSRGGADFFRARFRARGPRFPVSTAFLPFPLLQGGDGAYLQTTFSGKGSGRLAAISEIEADQALFPDLGAARPLAAIAVDPFRITFPVARRMRPAGSVGLGRG